MHVTKIAKLLPVIGIACMVGLPAMAQTASGTMAPTASNTMAPAATGKPAKTKHGSHADLPANQRFSSVSSATAHCPGGTVEWSAFGHSKIYHTSGSKYFGKTKHGAYACKSDLDAAGFRQAKN